MWVMAGAVLIDAIDGTLARAFHTKKNAPRIDGALMDNIIDFVTWTVAPLIWIYATMQIPIWILLICSIGSILGFSNKQAKTSDQFFRGFPNYWNIVVLYIFLIDIPDPYASAILLIFAFGTLVPVKFVYPSKTQFLKPFTIFLGSIFFLQLVLLLYYFDESPVLLLYSSFLFPVYYFGLSFYLNIKRTAT